MSKEFEGKVALVTGAASGIGAACALQLAASGTAVVVADLDEEGAKKVVAEIEAKGGKAASFRIDVSVPEEVAAMVAFAKKTFGALHLAVNNAGIGGPSAPVAEYPLDGWRKVIDINLMSVFYCMHYEIPAMLEAGGGAIVNMSSILGTQGFANSSAYVAAKHGVVGLTKTAAMEYATKNIRVTAVGPGFIETPLVTNNIDPEALKQITALHPVGRLGKPEEVAALTCFLLSDKASFITGSYHLVDGAYTAP
ncbi:SDR family NAD(P)-dependent oxidoreductase [Chelativorans composti]|uniref:SDR family NAD(P)-dependent oxidoreductase n=1 Tax=Chelativorans composti TaxID=768533 RepID=A0ABW5DGC1_9HYPH